MADTGKRTKRSIAIMLLLVEDSGERERGVQMGTRVEGGGAGC